MSIKDQIANSGILTNPFYIKYKQYIVPFAVIVSALLISILVTIPQFLRLFETFKTIEELTTKKQFYKEKSEQLEQMDLTTYQQDLDLALIALPVDKDIPGVTGEILTALSGSGLSLDGITFSNSPAESQKVQEFGMKVDVVGTRENLRNFLNRIKVTPRIIKLSYLETGKARGGEISASVGFVTLYQQLPENIGAVDEPIAQLSPENAKILADIKSRAGSIPTTVSSDPGTSGSIGKLNPFAP